MTEKETPTCEKMIKYEREKWQDETWRPAEMEKGRDEALWRTTGKSA